MLLFLQLAPSLDTTLDTVVASAVSSTLALVVVHPTTQVRVTAAAAAVVSVISAAAVDSVILAASVISNPANLADLVDRAMEVVHLPTAPARAMVNPDTVLPAMVLPATVLLATVTMIMTVIPAPATIPLVTVAIAATDTAIEATVPRTATTVMAAARATVMDPAMLLDLETLKDLTVSVILVIPDPSETPAMLPDFRTPVD